MRHPKTQVSLHPNLPITAHSLLNPLTAKDVLIDFTLSNARRFYSSKGDPSGTKGLIQTSQKATQTFPCRSPPPPTPS